MRRCSADTLAAVRRLIVNADDFGLTAGVNRAVVELHCARALSSATLMATASHFTEAVSLANQNSTLGVGCHVVLVDGTPALPPVQIPSLVDASSENETRFRQKLSTFVAELLRGRIKDTEIEAEATAQIKKLQQTGIHVTHVDTHKHTHIFPGVLRPLLRAALACGVKAIRNPFEPNWSLNATANAGHVRKMQVRLLRSQSSAFSEEVNRARLLTTDGAIGVLATGTLDALTIRNLLAAMPDGTWELVCHPGYNDEALQQANTRLLESRDVERTALLETIPHANAELIHFGQLA
ncbi:ChbG/HpnK family deacetylase [Alloacidobacterium dinghuense]|uniref:ChbG/HpnK family deacetylase n=1 Tax=Alloacidobacterium dinghuense TaxID=2763107 RepID=A0A7G8BMD6_9BACT|nr:ChbG/HpnK family deacetylase [Alloacidobacterium dinghuense]QNI33706.1 ChbG/HpnK family deacetylase [Alloacidobacterium dinghuense]